MDQWLVRTAENVIAGPYDRGQVVQLIREGRLGLQDELCLANHFWIYLHETEEVVRQLGREAVLLVSENSSDEATQTQTEPALQGEQGRAIAPPPLIPSQPDSEAASVIRLGRLNQVPLRRKPLAEADLPDIEDSRIFSSAPSSMFSSLSSFSWRNVIWLVCLIAWALIAGLYLLR